MRGYCVDGPLAGRLLDGLDTRRGLGDQVGMRGDRVYDPNATIYHPMSDEARGVVSGKLHTYYIRMIVNNVAQLWACAGEPDRLKIE